MLSTGRLRNTKLLNSTLHTRRVLKGARRASSKGELELHARGTLLMHRVKTVPHAHHTSGSTGTSG